VADGAGVEDATAREDATSAVDGALDSPLSPDAATLDARPDDGSAHEADADGDAQPSTAMLTPRNWELFATGMGIPLMGGSGPNDLWVSDTLFLSHYDGQTWTSYNPGVSRITGIWASAPNDAYASVAENVVLHWDGNAWTHESAGISQGSSFNSVWGSGPTDIYLAGLLHSGGGGTWGPANVPPQQVDYGGYPGMWGTGPDNLWFAGGYGTVRMKNGAWTTSVSYPPPEVTLQIQGTWGASVDDFFILSPASALRIVDGSVGPAQQVPLQKLDAGYDSMWAICGTSPNDLYIAHSLGLFRSAGDNQWVPEVIDADASTVKATSVWCAPGSNVVYVATWNGIYRTR
jgi:hypothetical protein